MPDDRHRYFSQGGEDALIWEFFDHKPSGFFVEVGAFDGVCLSNTYSFELDGWSGVCVEANPVFAQMCTENRPGSDVVHAAAVGDGSIGSITIKVEPLGLLSGVSPLSAEELAPRYAARGLEFNGFEEVSVPAKTLNKILDDVGAPRIDFLSIDVEGTEADVLGGLDLQKFDVGVVLLEANDAEAERTIDALMASHGYRVGRVVGPNRFFVRTEPEVERMHDIRIDIILEPAIHPSGANYSHPSWLEPRPLIRKPVWDGG